MVTLKSGPFLLGIWLFIIPFQTHALASIPYWVSSKVQRIEQRVQTIDQAVGSLSREQRDLLISEVESQKKETKYVQNYLANFSMPTVKSGWNQVFGDQCVEFCKLGGLKVGLSTEGAQCSSGENSVESSHGMVEFVWGCWPQCYKWNVKSTSVGPYCYKPGQKQDNDATDRTVGCFCQ